MTLYNTQSTFCVNSLAHWLGETPFDDKHSPRDHWLTALATVGEGYHNFVRPTSLLWVYPRLSRRLLDALGPPANLLDVPGQHHEFPSDYRNALKRFQCKLTSQAVLGVFWVIFWPSG